MPQAGRPLMTASTTRAVALPSHPIVFLFLILPFGILAGYLSVTIAYQLSRAGVGSTEIAGLLAISYLPHTWKFLWAPVVDTTMTPKRWHVLATSLCASGMYAMGVVPPTAASMPLLTAIVLLSNLAATFLAMAVESLMAHDTPDEEKGRAAGWFQAGNLGGVGVGGGIGLWVAERVAQSWIPGAMLAAVSMLCCAGLFFIRQRDTVQHAEGVWQNMRDVGRDLLGVARSRAGYLGLLICFLPIGSGAASNLWSILATDWKASADTVAVVNGMLSGLVAAGGSIVGGYLCDRMDRKTAYGVFGMLMAGCAVAMGLAPRTETTYILFVTLYAFITGFCYAGFSAVVLEAIGGGAAATKYSLFASLSNMPIAYMTAVNGWTNKHWGASSMLYIEAAIGMAALGLFIGVARLSRRAAPAQVHVPEAA